MIFPDELEKRAQRLFERRWRQWAVAQLLAPASTSAATKVAGQGASAVDTRQAPCAEERSLLRMGLKPPKEADFSHGASLAEAQDWVRAWDAPAHPCQVEWAVRHWAWLGEQRIPVSVALATASDVAVWAGQERLWERALERLGHCVSLAEEEGFSVSSEAVLRALSRWLGVWAKLADDDWHRGMLLLRWLLRNPEPRCFARQLPVRGLDTKWFEQMGSSFADLARLLTGKPIDFLRQTAPVFRCIAGSSALFLGGIRDYSLTSDELSRVPHRPKALLICENLVNVLCLKELLGRGDDLPELRRADGSLKLARVSASSAAEPVEASPEVKLAGALDEVLVIWGKGFAAEGLREVAWIGQVPIVYWGDIDTHGFAILGMVRAFAPQTHSVMMDEATLERYRDLCVNEPSPKEELSCHLTAAEAKTRARLSEQGGHLRLEQERIEWLWACGQLANALARA